MFIGNLKKNQIGFSDIINYAAFVEDGICQGKDGSLMSGWKFRGHDMHSSSNSELEYVSSLLNEVLREFGNGFMLQVDMVRKNAKTTQSQGHFPDIISQAIEYERNLQYDEIGTHFENEYVILLTYLPPTKMKGKMKELVYSEDNGNEKGADQILKNYKKYRIQFENVLERAFIEIEKLGLKEHGFDALLAHIHYCMTTIDQQVKLPETPMYLDTILGSQDFVGGLYPKIGDKYIKIIAIEGFPSESYPAILDGLNSMLFSYRWNTRFIFIDEADAKNIIEKKRRKWRQKIVGLKDQIFNTSRGSIDLDAMEMSNDAELARSDLNSGAISYGYYTSNVVLMDENPELLNQMAKEIVKVVRSAGFTSRIEDINAVEAYLGTLPSHGYQNVRKFMMHSLNLADLLPLTSVWGGLKENPNQLYPKNSPALFVCSSHESAPFFFNLHVSDVGHTMILGSTGSGKSTLLGLIIAQFYRYKDAQVFTFDKDYSLYVLCKALGGNHYDIAGDSGQLTFCPLKDLDTDSKRSWATEWIELLLSLQGVNITPDDRNNIYKAVLLLAESKSRTLTDLVGTIQNNKIKKALEYYTLSGAMGTLLDSEDDSLSDSRLSVFEMEHLMSRGDKDLLPVLTYLFNEISRKCDGSPTLLVLDEAWLMLSNKFFVSRIRDWLKTMRKKNVAVVFATQSISDILKSDIKDILLESCPTKIYLPNAEAGNEHSKQHYLSFGLSERQIEIIKDSVPKHHYYYNSPLGKRLLSLDLGQFALSFVGASGKEEIKLVRELSQKPDWIEDYLKYANLYDWIDVAKSGGKNA